MLDCRRLTGFGDVNTSRETLLYLEPKITANGTGAGAAMDWDFDTTAGTGRAVSVVLESVNIRLVFNDFEAHAIANRFGLVRAPSRARQIPMLAWG